MKATTRFLLPLFLVVAWPDADWAQQPGWTSRWTAAQRYQRSPQLRWASQPRQAAWSGPTQRPPFATRPMRLSQAYAGGAAVANGGQPGASSTQDDFQGAELVPVPPPEPGGSYVPAPGETIPGATIDNEYILSDGGPSFDAGGSTLMPGGGCTIEGFGGSYPGSGPCDCYGPGQSSGACGPGGPCGPGCGAGPAYGPGGYGGGYGAGPAYGPGGYGGGYGYYGSPGQYWWGVYGRLTSWLRSFLFGSPCPYRRIYAEYLCLRPGNDKISYAVPVNGAIVPPAGVSPIQIGLEAEVDTDFDSGYRVGWNRAISPCSNIGFMFTWLDSDARDQVAINAPFVIRSIVAHPGTPNAGADFNDALATAGVDYKLFDLTYQRECKRDCHYAVDYLIGIRYARLHQGFDSWFTSTNVVYVGSDVRFDGGGLQFGLEAERFLPNPCWRLYSKAAASFVGGKFRSEYRQGNNFDGLVVSTGWKDERLVSILDLELGLGWVSPTGRWRLSCGYLFSAWYNVVKTDEFIRGVQQNFSGGVSDTLTFDGFKAAAEYRY